MHNHSDTNFTHRKKLFTFVQDFALHGEDNTASVVVAEAGENFLLEGNMNAERVTNTKCANR